MGKKIPCEALSRHDCTTGTQHKPGGISRTSKFSQKFAILKKSGERKQE